MIIYLLYIGLVLGHAMDKTSGLGSAIVALGAVLAVGVATLVLEHMLSLAWPRALAVVLANGALAWVAAKVLLPIGVFLFKGI